MYEVALSQTQVVPLSQSMRGGVGVDGQRPLNGEQRRTKEPGHRVKMPGPGCRVFLRNVTLMPGRPLKKGVLIS